MFSQVKRSKIILVNWLLCVTWELWIVSIWLFHWFEFRSKEVKTTCKMYVEKWYDETMEWFILFFNSTKFKVFSFKKSSFHLQLCISSQYEQMLFNHLIASSGEAPLNIGHWCHYDISELSKNCLSLEPLISSKHL